jgi:nucleoside diphosphate kinase
LKDKPFFPGLIKYMAAGPVVAMVWEGLDAVKTGRAILGATNPLASAPGENLVFHFWAMLTCCSSQALSVVITP